MFIQAIGSDLRSKTPKKEMAELKVTFEATAHKLDNVFPALCMYTYHPCKNANKNRCLNLMGGTIRTCTSHKQRHVAYTNTIGTCSYGSQ